MFAGSALTTLTYTYPAWRYLLPATEGMQLVKEYKFGKLEELHVRLFTFTPPLTTEKRLVLCIGALGGKHLTPSLFALPAELNGYLSAFVFEQLVHTKFHDEPVNQITQQTVHAFVVSAKLVGALTEATPIAAYISRALYTGNSPIGVWPRDAWTPLPLPLDPVADLRAGQQL